MKDKKLHMIGNAHLDPVWLWNWQEGFQEAKATFKSALDRMEEDDNFVFTCSSAAFYEWVEKNNPAMFAQIQKRVKEGRWELAEVGGSSRTVIFRQVSPSCGRGCMGSGILWKNSVRRR